MSAPERVLWATNISKTFTEASLLPSTSLTLHRRQKIAILGPNGSGKSTLLSLLAGLTTPDTGNITLKSGLTLAYIPQSLPDIPPDMSVTHAIMHLAEAYTTAPVVRLVAAYMRGVNVDMESLPGAWGLWSYVRTVIERLEIPEVDVSRMSGGQKKRVAIAAALISKPDVILLDEVTNHLSVDAIQFLEHTLGTGDMTVLAISHDRYFVDAVCKDAIWEVDNGVSMFSGGYHNYLQEKIKREATEEKDVKVLKRAYEKEMEWMRRQPKARETKSKSREQEVLRLGKELKRREQRPVGVGELRNLAIRMGGQVVTLQNVTLERGGNKILHEFSYTFQKGERVGIVGGNGVGKSTFLKMLAGEWPVDGRTVGETVRFGYFDQEGDIELMKGVRGIRMEDMRVLDFAKELIGKYADVEKDVTGGGGGVEERLDREIEALSFSRVLRKKEKSENWMRDLSVYSLLELFGFRGDKHHLLIERCSGGERRRLQLMELLIKDCNFLLLDEVSNDLDVRTLTMVEEVLLRYSGVLVLCSHDRLMLDRLVDHLIVLDGNGNVTKVEGKFTDYLSEVKSKEEEMRKSSKKKEQIVVKKDKARMSFKQRKEYEQLTKDLEKVQRCYEETSELLQNESQTADVTQIITWGEQVAAMEKKLEQMSDRWLELAELAEVNP